MSISTHARSDLILATEPPPRPTVGNRQLSELMMMY